MDMQNDTNTKLSAIDKALAAAKARKAAKDSLADDTQMTAPKAKSSKPRAIKAKPQVDATAKVAAKAAREAERAVRQTVLKTQREARRAAKAAERAGSIPHMKKIAKAAAALPSMSSSMTLTFNEVTTNFSAEQINALSLHLQHFNRVKATERALGQKLEAGATVRIISGPNKYVGMTGTVAKAQRIRCFVEIPGFSKQVYLFTSDVEMLEGEQATGTEG